MYGYPMKLITILFFLSLSPALFASFLEFNSMKLNKNKELSLNLSETSINLLIKDFSEEFEHKIIFKVSEQSSINAYATIDNDDIPTVVIPKKLFSHPLIDIDGISLLICHEIGHFYGGAPKQYRGNSKKKSWSSAEGQADFYSTSICLKKLLPQNNPKFDIDKYPNIKIELSQICQNQNCFRIGLASYKISKIYAEIKFWNRELSVLKKDSSKVFQILRGHPNPQCRLDTLIAGLLCQEIRDLSQSEELFLTCTEEQYKQPSCWFSSNKPEDI